MGMVNNNAEQIIQVLTHPVVCCLISALSQIWQIALSSSDPGPLKMKGLAQGHREVSFVCKAGSLRAWALELGTPAVTS